MDTTKLKLFLDEKAKEDKFSGVVLIAKDFEPIFEYVAGFANQELQIKNNLDTKFNIASIGKMFTGVAIAKLVEEKLLNFDDKVGKYLPDYPNKSIKEKATIHNLLTHTSGLGTIFNKKYIELENSLKEVKDYLEVFQDEPLLFEPGEGYQYSSAAYILLGRIIEVITNKNYFDYIKKNIFNVAGMEDIGYFEIDKSLPNLANPYTHRKVFSKEMDLKSPRRNNLSELPFKGVPGGGEFSTVYDLLKFAKSLWEFKFLSKDMTEFITSPRQDTPKSQFKNGYGFYILEMEGHKIIGREGGLGGISTIFHMYQDVPFIVIVLCNFDEPIAKDIAIFTAKLIS
ncbi:beta-lactamase family protein [Candidatus Daviesbacteria bacterium]|nr:beta-lactamase family protein [Candidatus Daviesbacteria bacterium]